VTLLDEKEDSMKASVANLSVVLLAGPALACALALHVHAQESQSTSPAGSSSTTSAQQQLPPLQGIPITGARLGTPPPGAPPPLTPSQIAALNARPAPAYVLYYSLFATVAGLNQGADRRETEGKDGNEMRLRIPKAAGLTDAEGVVLNEVVEDCMRQLKAVDAERKAIMDARQGQSQGSSTALPGNRLTMEEFSRFASEQREIVEEHIGELKSQLGDAGFAKLDAYVRALYKPVVAQPKPGAQRFPPVASPQSGSGPQ
jgi:hypothetical protein